MSKPSIAISYSMKKKAKKMSKGGNPYSKMEESKRSNMASGGMVKSGDPEMDYSKGGEVDQEGVHTPTKPKGGQSMPGDLVRGSNSKSIPPHQGEYLKDLSSAMHKSKLEELKSMKGPHGNYADGGEVPKPSPEPQPQLVSSEESKKFAQGMCPSCGYSDGGEVSSHHGHTDSGYQTASHEMDMVGRAMVRHGMQMLSKGGQVANELEEGAAADEKPNEFDDLVLDDGLEFSETGENSGDKDGDPDPDKKKNDLVARAMLRKKAKR